MGNAGRVQTILLAIIVVVLAVAALRATWIVSMPLALAVFLAVLLWPLQRWLQRRLPRWLSIVLVVVTLFIVVTGVGLALGFSINEILQRGPDYVEPIQQRIDRTIQWAQSIGLPVSWQRLENSAPAAALSGLRSSIQPIWMSLGVISLAVFLLLLLLIELDQWQQKANEAFNADTSRNLFDSMHTIVEQLQSYLAVRTVISLIAGVVTWVLCLALGVDLAFTWGVLTFLLNYLPNIGSLIAYIPPAIFAWVQYDWKWGVVTLAILGVSDAILGNVVEPLFHGRSLRISPFIVLLSVVFWGWVWGIGGAVLGVPITASIAIICYNVEGLKPIGRLLASAK